MHFHSSPSFRTNNQSNKYGISKERIYNVFRQNVWEPRTQQELKERALLCVGASLCFFIATTATFYIINLILEAAIDEIEDSIGEVDDEYILDALLEQIHGIPYSRMRLIEREKIKQLVFRTIYNGKTEDKALTNDDLERMNQGEASIISFASPYFKALFLLSIFCKDDVIAAKIYNELDYKKMIDHFISNNLYQDGLAKLKALIDLPTNKSLTDQDKQVIVVNGLKNPLNEFLTIIGHACLLPHVDSINKLVDLNIVPTLIDMYYSLPRNQLLLLTILYTMSFNEKGWNQIKGDKDFIRTIESAKYYQKDPLIQVASKMLVENVEYHHTDDLSTIRKHDRLSNNLLAPNIFPLLTLGILWGCTRWSFGLLRNTKIRGSELFRKIIIGGLKTGLGASLVGLYSNGFSYVATLPSVKQHLYSGPFPFSLAASTYFTSLGVASFATSTFLPFIYGPFIIYHSLQLITDKLKKK